MSHPHSAAVAEPTSALPAHNGKLLNIVGRSYFPVAFIGRLPFAMTVVGVLTLIVAVTGSVADAGITSATVGLGTALAGPFVGMAADRFGQRPVLLTAVAVHATALITLTVLTYSHAPLGWLMVGAFMIGASAPQLAAMSRARLLTIISTLVSPARRSRTLNSTMSIESVADELVFVFGPVAVGLLAVSFGAWAPLAIAALFTIVFVGWFALHPSGALAAAHERATRGTEQAERAPMKEFLAPRYLALVFSMLMIGAFFGAMLTSLTGFMEELGRAESAGVLYGALGIGSAIMALSMTIMPQRFRLHARFLVFALVMFAAALGLLAVQSEVQMTWVLVLLGIGIGPVLVTIFSIASERSPKGRTATLMTILSSSIVVGQATLSAVTGRVVEQVGVDAALKLPVYAVGAIVVGAVITFIILHSESPSKAVAASV